MTVAKTPLDMPETENLANHRASEGSVESAALPLAQQVAARIRDMIIQDQLTPGEWIREQDLADKLNVSRTPLREALKMLEARDSEAMALCMLNHLGRTFFKFSKNLESMEKSRPRKRN